LSDLVPPAPDVDPELLHRAQAGEEAAFGALMKSHYEPVFRLVYSIVRNEHDARDVCQEVWLTVWKQLAGFRGDAKFTTWLHPIAVRRAVDHLRKRRRWFDRFLPFATGDETVEAVPEPASPSDLRADTEQADRATLLRRAIDALPPKLRAVLALREIQGLSYEEIARATGIPAGTVMSRLYHARRQLAQKLKDQP
jgi:RNA polymerase sigma-70 factor (ECF subfamily)